MSKRGQYLGYVPFGDGHALAFVDPKGQDHDWTFDIVFASEDEVEPDEIVDDEPELEFVVVADLPNGYRVLGTRVRGASKAQPPFFLVGPKGGTVARGFRSIAAVVEYATRHALIRQHPADEPIVSAPGP